jgi:hypothetical protein
MSSEPAAADLGEQEEVLRAGELVLGTHPADPGRADRGGEAAGTVRLRPWR